MLGELYTTILFQPILNVLVALYTYVPGHDMGIAIILLTVLIKLLLYPLSQRALKAQKSMSQLQPKVNAIKEQFKDNKERQAQEMMKLYKDEKINPLSSCLPLLIQLPFLIAVYQAFSVGLGNGNLDLLYSFVPRPETINTMFLGFVNLSQPNVVLALMAGAAQFWQARMMPQSRAPKGVAGAKDEDMAAALNKQMMYVMPVMTVVIGISLPGGLALYWFAMTALTALQQMYTLRSKTDTSTPASIIEA